MTVCSRRDRALLWCCLGAGLRIGEACKLRRGDLGSDGGLLIERSRAKSKKSRRVYLSPQARAIVQEWYESLPSQDPGAALFPSRKGGGHIKLGSRLVENLLASAGIRGATSHSLRRTHATRLRDNHADVQSIKAQLGHSSIAITERYMEVYPHRQRDDVAGLVF
jgi:integrase/recombinase XerD